MRGAAVLKITGLVLGLAWFALPRASAEADISTIYLTNGGKLRGEIVVDMPGSPLTVMVAGQAIQVQRETISRIEGAAGTVAPSTAAPVAAGAPIVAQPVAPIIAPPPQPMVAPVVSGGPIVLQFDRRGRAAVQPHWSPELQQLVSRRNDVAYSMNRKGIGAPVAILSVGAVGIIATAIGASLATKAYQSCVEDKLYSSSYDTCSSAAPVTMAVGYSLSSLLFAGGATFLLIRLLKKKSLRRQLATIDQDLQRFNVAPMASVHPRAKLGISTAGLSLRAAF